MIEEGLVARPRYEERLEQVLDVPVIKVLTGIRRCGKSTLLRMTAQKIRSAHPEVQIAHLSLEAPENLSVRTPEALLALVEHAAADRSTRAYIFLDEVQLVPGWEQVVNAIHSHWDCDIYITGSNSQMLSGELATLLAGRNVEIRVHPFTFREYCDAHGYGPGQIDEAFSTYLQWGGFPMLRYFAEQPREMRQYLASVYDSVLVRDVMERHAIRDVDLFQRVARYCLANVGRPFSAASISRYLKSEGRRASVDTVLNYLSFCTEAFIVDRVRREDIASKRLLAVDEKFYVADLGLRTALGFSNQKDIELALENVVYRELAARGWEVTVGRVDGKEIDFVARRGSERMYIQVAYLLASEETIEREFGVYRSVPDNFPKFVLSMDPVDASRDGIVHRNIVRWLWESD